MTIQTKTVAIFGAGTGLGASVARRFGREGFRMALVARRKSGLDALVAELRTEGVEARAFPADLTDIAGIPALVQRIEHELGGIGVALYAPVPAEVGFVPAVELDAAKLQPLTTLFTLAPVEVAHALLPGMLARGGGAIVVGGGLSAIVTIPGLSGVGPAMAGARNYVLSLNAELKDKGVYAGSLMIGALIERSAGYVAMTASGEPIHFPIISPDAIADEVWSLVTKRDRVEAVLPAMPAH